MDKYFKQGLITPSYYNDFTKWTSDSLRKNFNNLVNPPATTGSSGFNFGLDTSGLRYTPVGAFYDSRSEATDNATSIADTTLTLFDDRQQGLTATQLATQDINRDGQLSGAELINISAWTDLNENGQVDADEMKSLAQRGITRIRSNDFEFFTRGNTRLAGSEVSEAGLVSGNRSTPDSNFRYLRDHNPVFELPEGHIYWNPDMVKIPYRQQNFLVGTDSDDSFDANYYADYARYLNINLLTHFMGGGGNDRVGGSSRNDFIWGGTGNDSLWGYAGNDGLWGEEGNDQISGDEGDDYLHGGVGLDSLYGGLGNDTLDGGDGNDYLVGNDGSDRLLGGAGNDEMQGNFGDDQLLGEAGDDRIFGQLGNDQIWGGDGNDVLVGFTANKRQQADLAGGRVG